MDMDDNLLLLLEDYPPHTACIAYELPLCRGIFHCFVGAAPTDDALSLAAHLAIHKPNARMLGWANNRRAPRTAEPSAAVPTSYQLPEGDELSEADGDG